MLHHRLAKLLRALPFKPSFDAVAGPQNALFESMESRLLMAFNPTADEQYTLELINDMRENPAAHLSRLISGISKTTGIPIGTSPEIQHSLDYFEVNGAELMKQWSVLTAVAPLAWNDALSKAAETHNTIMISADEQSHQVHSKGEADLVTRNTEAGYTNFRFMGENLFNFALNILYGHAGFAIDWGFTDTGIQTPAGHRDNIMSPNFKEIGMDIQAETNPDTKSGPLVITQEFGDRFTLTNPYLLGSVFNDLNGNGFYESGEGLAGVTVTMKSATQTFTTTSLTAGGYQINAPAGTYTVTYSGGAFTTPVVRNNVVLGASNVRKNVTLQELAPSVAVSGNGQKIANNDTTPSASDGTLITDLNPVGETTRTFTIQNQGNAQLNLSNFNLSGPFTLTDAPLLSLNPGASTDFTVRFNPTVTGSFSGTFSFATNDNANKTFSFKLQADVTLPEPNIVVTGNSIVIADNDATPAADDNTLVAVPFNGVGSNPAVRSFEIFNKGTEVLKITSALLSTGYTFQSAAPTAIDPGSSAFVTVIFNPTAAGNFNGTLTLQTNDPDTPTYNFSLQTQAVATPPTFTGSVSIFDASVFRSLTFKAGVLVSNTGPVVVNGVKAEFFLSKDITLDASDLRLETLTSTAKILPGQDLDLNGSFKAPATAPPGNYFLISKLTSSSVVIVPEASAATISVQEIPKLPDLSLTASVTGALFSPGDKVKAGFTARNLGPGSVGASQVRFVLSTDKIRGNADDVLLAEFDTPALAVGAAFTSASNFFTIPETTDGSYFILAGLDPDGLITEKSETNNSFTSAALKVFHPMVSLKGGAITKFSESASTGSFTLTRSAGSTLSPLTVNLDIAGSAVQNTDYKLQIDKTIFDGKSIVIPAGKASVTVKIVGIDDSAVETAENIQITLLPDVASPAVYRVNPAQTTASFTIEDNEPSIKIVATSSKSSESGTAGTFTATRKSSNNKQALTVNFTASGVAALGTDYKLVDSKGNLLTDSFTFAANATTFAFKVVPIDDASIEGDESAVVTIVPVAGEPTYTIEAQNTATVNIIDNEPSIKLVATTSKASEPSGVATFTATRKSTSSKLPLTVAFAVSGTAEQGTDFKLTTGDGKVVLTDSFTFAPNSTTFTIKLMPLDDILVEGDQSVTLTLIPVAGEPTYTIEAQNSGTAIIKDNEPIISLAVASADSKEGAARASAFTFSRNPGSSSAETLIKFKITGDATVGNDFSLLAGTKASAITVEETADGFIGTILLPKSAPSAVLNLFAARDHNNDEPTETVNITLLPTDNYSVGAKNAATARILDVDVPRPIAVAPLVLPDLGARINITSGTSKTAKISILGVAGLVTQTTFQGNLFSTDNWVGTYSYKTLSAGPDAGKIIFTAVIRAGSAPAVGFDLTLVFNGVRPANLTGKQISFYPDATPNTDGTFVVTGLPSDPGAVITGTFAL